MIVLINDKAGKQLNLPTSKKEITFDYVASKANVKVPPYYALIGVLSYTTIQDLSLADKTKNVKSMSTPFFIKAGHLDEGAALKGFYEPNDIIIATTSDLMQAIHVNALDNELSINNACNFIKADKLFSALTGKVDYTKVSDTGAKLVLTGKDKFNISNNKSLNTDNAKSVYTIDYKLIPINDIKGCYTGIKCLPKLADGEPILPYIEDYVAESSDVKADE